MITLQTHHDEHEMKIHLNKPGRVSYAALRCVSCNKHIQWLNKSTVDLLESEGIKIYDRKENHYQ